MVGSVYTGRLNSQNLSAFIQVILTLVCKSLTTFAHFRMQVAPDATKFGDKGIEHVDLLNALFGGTLATREAAWAPS